MHLQLVSCLGILYLNASLLQTRVIFQCQELQDVRTKKIRKLAMRYHGRRMLGRKVGEVEYKG